MLWAHLRRAEEVKEAASGAQGNSQSLMSWLAGEPSAHTGHFCVRICHREDHPLLPGVCVC